jgi:tetratricopeptide (TPR) repeat protein
MAKRFVISLFTIVCLFGFVSLAKAQAGSTGASGDFNDPSNTGTLLTPLKIPKAKKQAKLKTPEEYLMRGTEFFADKNYDLAIEDFTEAIKKKPSYIEALIERGNAYMARSVAFLSRSDREKGFNDYKEAIKLNPNSIEAHFNLAVACYQLNNFDDAISEYNEIIKIQADYVDAYNNRAYAYRKKGNLNKALEDFTEAIKLKPEYSEAYINRALVYKATGDKEKAIEDFKEVIKINKVANAVQFAKQELLELGVDLEDYK